MEILTGPALKTVFILYHTHIDEKLDDGEDVKMIGVYSTREKAMEAQKRSEDLPGFIDFKEGFEIFPYEIDGKDS